MSELALTNDQFAARIGCHFTMASRLRNGQRLPSVTTLIRIAREFDIPVRELAEAYDAGPESFGKLVRDRIYKIREKPVILVA